MSAVSPATDLFVIDVHAHLGATREFMIPRCTPEDLVRMMDATHTRIAIVSHQACLAPFFETGYAETTAALSRHPERLRAYVVYDPNWPDDSTRWMERCLGQPGYVGIKVHPSRHGVDPTDPRYADLWAFADERGLVVLTHSWAPDAVNPRQNFATPERFAPVLERHRRLHLLLGHAGGRPVGHQQAVELVRAFPNCSMDISGDTLTLGITEWLVERAGVDRVLYGSDQNWIDPRHHLGRVLRADLSEEQKMAILAGNAQRLFGL